MEVNPYLTSSVDNCCIIELSRHHHANGNLTVVEDNDPIPFKIRRTYYTYDIPGGEERGGHAHRALYQLIVAISGSFDVVIDDGVKQRIVTLNRPYQGLLITPGIWRVLNNFTSGAVCMVLASEHYDESDYTREYSDFLSLTQDKRQA
ncbi:MAG: WxcM-like domain-containing protein [Bacteroidales bacterium]|nr:WxcM-like domain-containing protein [Candidatus Sodaliphilus limicaballi]